MPDVVPLGARPDRATYFQGFQELARWRVQNILLVASPYDAFILAEDDQLNELLLSEFLGLTLRNLPAVTQVSTVVEALALARDTARYNLVITSPRVGDTDARTLARALRRASIETPIALLAYDERDLAPYESQPAPTDIEWTFLWQGDVHILLAIAKCIEDWMNAPFDTGVMGIQAILVVEDRTRFYSSFLPIVYREVMAQARRLVPEGINLAHKLMRIQARPKILLCRTYEDAWQAFACYRDNIIGVISDIEFTWRGELRHDAGVELTRNIRRQQPDVPIVLQSGRAENEALARSLGASFLLKGSPTLLNDLRRVMLDTFGFGDFVFRLPGGAEVGRAADLRSLEAQLSTVPVESVGFHAERNHFSSWLKARTEFSLAHELRPRRVSDFRTLEHLRRDLIEAIQRYRREVSRGGISDFKAGWFDPDGGVFRVGGGSLGGKARGLAFVNHLLSESGLRERFPGVEIGVPTSVVIGTDYFDEFLARNDLGDYAITVDDDADLFERFMQADLPRGLVEALEAFTRDARYPLAVRSSSLLEDSQYQPFAGIYDTHMLASQEPAARLARVIEAVKRVYASTFSSRAKAYLRATAYRLEEEKMAVVLQRLVGTAHADRFYPDMAGVARSRNYYAKAPVRPEDGIVAVALGLGATVVEGETCLRFCPKYPRHPLSFSSVKDALKNSQRQFHALRLTDGGDEPSGRWALGTFDLDVAERDGTLAFVGSTYSKENDAIYDGISRPGPRVVTFAPVLKHGLFPLSDVLSLLLEMCAKSTNSPVEIEFAVRLARDRGQAAEFAFLQLRPLAEARQSVELDLEVIDPASLACRSSLVLGNGRIDGLRDVLVVDQHRFERAQSRAVAREVAQLNAELVRARRPYILIGVGRWGSSDPHLGIPVTWDQISGARVIVEAGFKDLLVTPSQGSHFFQNLTARSVGYYTVNPQVGEGFVDWEWLRSQAPTVERGCVRHLRFEADLVVKMDGRSTHGVILKPGVGDGN